ncbi:MAG: DUF2255 family protein [bacterium]|nr:DUF2255 family protein [bacterium]
MKSFITPLIAFFIMGCTSVIPPRASGPIDWGAVQAVEVPELLTLDADGSSRRTKLWLAVVDDRGYLRTSDSRWFANIQRDPNIELLIGGATYPLRASVVSDSDSELRTRVNLAFRSKYGIPDRVLGWFGNEGGKNMMQLERR